MISYVNLPADDRWKMEAFMPKLIRIILVTFLVAACVYVISRYDLQAPLKEALIWARDSGVLGTLVFVGVYVLAAVLLVPVSLLSSGAGAIYGLATGFLVVILAATLGAACAFLLGRYLVGNWVRAKIRDNPRLRAMDDAVAREGWRIVGLTRLSPVFPYNLLNYVFGLTKITLGDFIGASLVGMIPGTLMYVYLGTLAGNFAGLNDRAQPYSSLEVFLYCLGFLSTVSVTIIVARIARKSLRKQIDL